MRGVRVMFDSYTQDELISLIQNALADPNRRTELLDLLKRMGLLAKNF